MKTLLTKVENSQEQAKVGLRSLRNKNFLKIKRAGRMKSMNKKKKREVKVLIVRKSKIRILIANEQR